MWDLIWGLIQIHLRFDNAQIWLAISPKHASRQTQRRLHLVDLPCREGLPDAIVSAMWTWNISKMVESSAEMAFLVYWYLNESLPWLHPATLTADVQQHELWWTWIKHTQAIYTSADCILDTACSTSAGYCIACQMTCSWQCWLYPDQCHDKYAIFN